VSSRKRWQNVYADSNPFALPQAVLKRLGECCRQGGRDGTDAVQYLWLHLPDPNNANDAPFRLDEARHHLTLDEWLDIIDESASIGTATLIISVGVPFTEQPLLAALTEWAQVTHDMLVGVHRYGGPLMSGDAEVLQKLNPRRTRLFVDAEYLASADAVEANGIRVYSAEGHEEETVSHRCELPSTMTCVDSGGHMYTCGLVLGKEKYGLGHFFDRKLASVIKDDSLPHVIPEGLSEEKHRCNGCPPLMAQRLHDNAL
jgi:hypothetical protein